MSRLSECDCPKCKHLQSSSTNFITVNLGYLRNVYYKQLQSRASSSDALHLNAPKRETLLPRVGLGFRGCVRFVVLSAFTQPTDGCRAGVSE